MLVMLILVYILDNGGSHVHSKGQEIARISKKNEVLAVLGGKSVKEPTARKWRSTIRKRRKASESSGSDEAKRRDWYP
jgi:hypothetical protein